MASKNAWNILVGVELDVDANQIQKELNQKLKGMVLEIDTRAAKENLTQATVALNNTTTAFTKTSDAADKTTDSVEKTTKANKKNKKSVDDLKLSYQAANAIFRTTVDILGSMASQVFELDTAQTEFKKVSDLSGDSLNSYVSSLSEMGLTVGRTGKPKCLSRDVQMVNVH